MCHTPPEKKELKPLAEPLNLYPEPLQCNIISKIEMKKCVLMMQVNSDIRIAMVSSSDQFAIRLMLMGVKVAGRYASVQSCLKAMETEQFNVLIMDTHTFSHRPKIATSIHYLRQQHPLTKVLLVSARAQHADIRAWLNAGTSGIVTSDEMTHGLLGIINSIHRGQMTLSPKILEMLLA